MLETVALSLPQLILVVAALLTSTLSGMTGLGGGTILAALMFNLLDPVAALPLHAAVQLTSNGARTVAFSRHVDRRALGLFLLTAIPAPFLVAPLVVQLDAVAIQTLLGVFLLVMVRPGWLKKLRLAGSAAFPVAGLFAGGLGAVVGATGSIIAPFYLQEGWAKERVVGTKAVCQACAHVLKLLAFATVGITLRADLLFLALLCIAVIAGTFLGKRLLGQLNERTFALIYRVLIVALGLRLLAQGLMAWGGGHA